MDMFRQGDLLFRKVDRIPNGFSISKDPVILRGEATGHKHELVNGVVFRAKYHRELYIEVLKSGRIIHEEHATLELPMGIFQVIRQREYPNIDVMD